MAVGYTEERETETKFFLYKMKNCSLKINLCLYVKQNYFFRKWFLHYSYQPCLISMEMTTMWMKPCNWMKMKPIQMEKSWINISSWIEMQRKEKNVAISNSVMSLGIEKMTNIAWVCRLNMNFWLENKIFGRKFIIF